MAVPTRLNPNMEALGWEIQPTDANLHRHWLLGRYPIKLQPELDDAFNAFHNVLIAVGYENPCDYVGSYHYRAITGTDGLASTHAYATAIDHDYGGDTDGDGDPTVDNNPHIHRIIRPGDPGFGVVWQILEWQVEKLEAIENTHGEQMWKWLGWPIGDTMHWQIDVAKDRVEVDWSTVYTGEEEGEDEMYNEWVEGWVIGLAEDKTKTRQEFTRLNTVPAADGGYILEPANNPPTVDYWVDMLDHPADPSWRGFFARTSLSTWGR